MLENNSEKVACTLSEVLLKIESSKGHPTISLEMPCSGKLVIIVKKSIYTRTGWWDLNKEAFQEYEVGSSLSRLCEDFSH